MKRFLIFLILFILVAVGAIVAYMPLGYIAAQSGAGRAGVGWAQVQGTLLEGRIDGLHVQGQPLGDVRLNLRPLSLLTFAPVYDIQWGGPGGQGTGVVKISKGRIEAQDVRLQHQINAVEALAAPVRALGGTVRIANGNIVMTALGCESASGKMTTDTLQVAAQQYGREFGLIEGPISCVDRALILDLSGTSQTGDTVDVDAKASVLGTSLFEVAIDTADTQMTLALSQIGFVFSDGAWRYKYEQEGSLAP